MRGWLVALESRPVADSMGGAMSTGWPAQLSLFDAECAAPAQSRSEASPAPSPRQMLPLLAPDSLPPPPRNEVLARAEHLAFHLSKELGVPVRLSVTDNRSTMVSFNRQGAELRLRVHHMFLDAPAPVVRALAQYTGRGRRAAGRVLDRYIEEQQPRVRRERSQGASKLEAKGRCVDLKAIYEQRIKPGTKLGEEALAGVFSVSRGHIRRVLQALSHQKVVELIPNRGAFVTKPTEADARDIFSAPGCWRRSSSNASRPRRTRQPSSRCVPISGPRRRRVTMASAARPSAWPASFI